MLQLEITRGRLLQKHAANAVYRKTTLCFLMLKSSRLSVALKEVWRKCCQLSEDNIPLSFPARRLTVINKKT